MTIELSAAELVFAKRTLPHFRAGKSALEAAQAVLDDDVRLYTAFCERSHSHMTGFGENSRSAMTRAGTGDVISSEITKTVYGRLRATSAGDA